MRKRTFITLVCVITVPMLTAVAVVAYRMNEVSFARCSSFEGERRASCFEKLVRRDVKQRGLAQAQRIWAQRVAVDHGVLSSCHLAWHPIGEARGHQLRRQGKSLLAGVPHNTCEEGFTHGVFIGYTASQHVEPARVARFCAGRTGVLGSPINCVHAVGHVLQRPFKRQLSPRLEQDCLTVARVMVGASRSTKSIALDNGFVVQCWRGALMEHAFAQDKTKSFRTAAHTGTRMCNKLSSPAAKSICYTELTTWLILVRPSDVERLARVCSSVPRAYGSHCARGFGIGEGDDARCRQMPQHLRQSCKQGAFITGALSAPSD